MKKILLAVTAALAITSCSQNEEFENPNQKAEINFSTVVKATSRAGIGTIYSSITYTFLEVSF